MRTILLWSLCLISLNSIASEIPSAHYEFNYKIRLELPKDGSKVRLWVPHPNASAFQVIRKVNVQSPLKWSLTKEKKYGNQILYFEGTPTERRLDVSISYEVIRYESRGLRKERAKKDTIHDPSWYLNGDRKVPLAPAIKEIAAAQIKALTSKDEQIRALYDYIVKTMSYDKSGTGWGNGDAIWACTNKRGNCTDFHSLFIALSRSVGIPARFFVGFPIPKDKNEGEIPGYHCWAEAYSPKLGWIPLDASEAKKSGHPEQYFAKLPPDRIEFTLGRDMTLEPPQKGEPLNFFIYPYAEVDGEQFEKMIKEFHFKKI